MSTFSKEHTGATQDASEVSKEATAAAFALSAAVTVLFNVILAFVKDSYAPLNTFMAHLTGHHWTTHGLADIVVFVVLGWVFKTAGIPSSGLTEKTAVTLGWAIVIAGALLGLWFLFV